MVRVARTLAQVSEEHIEGDVDGAVGSSVVFDLANTICSQDMERKGAGRGQGHGDTRGGKTSSSGTTSMH